jgi:DNA anti-recombination protein RmuC
MTTSDLTVEILREIRDEARQTNRRLAAVESRLGSMDERLGSMDERLESMDQRLGRTEQGLSDLGQFMRQIALDQARHERFHTHHVDVLERDVEDLKGRVRKIEDKVGH